jgi:hypothetical protein
VKRLPSLTGTNARWPFIPPSRLTSAARRGADPGLHLAGQIRRISGFAPFGITFNCLKFTVEGSAAGLGAAASEASGRADWRGWRGTGISTEATGDRGTATQFRLEVKKHLPHVDSGSKFVANERTAKANRLEPRRVRRPIH